MVHTACLVYLISTENSRSKKKIEKKLITSGTSSRHITKLKQSILLRCLWLKLTPNFISNSKDSIFNFFSPETGLNFSPEVELKVTKKKVKLSILFFKNCNLLFPRNGHSDIALSRLNFTVCRYIGRK
jgi:hypothetical protein